MIDPPLSEEAVLKIRSSRLVLAAATLGLASLTFVGVGGYAAFTDQVTTAATITSGTFQVGANAGTVSVGCTANGLQQEYSYFGSSNCFEWAAVNASTNMPVLNITPPTTSNSASATLTVGNVVPGVFYAADITAQDWGTAQGLISQVTYTPPTSTSTLAQGSNIYIYQYAGSAIATSSYTPSCGNYSSSPSTTIGSSCYATSKNLWTLVGEGNAGSSITAKTVNGFVQPWLSGPNGRTAPGDEGGVTFKLVVAVSDALANTSSGISNEAQTFNASFAVQGTTLP